MMKCKVTFEITISHHTFKPPKPEHNHPSSWREYREVDTSLYKTGTVTIEDFPFIPWEGLHLGDWQIVNVCQVYYLGCEGEKPVFLAQCEHVDDPRIGIYVYEPTWESLEAMEEAIRSRTKMDWTFREEQENNEV